MSKTVAKAVLPIANSGKVRIGFKSNIRLDAFPHQEYGILEGSVNNISLLPQTGKESDNYLLELTINDSLITTYNKKLSLKQEMQGMANIITEDRRVIERVFDKLLDLIWN